MPTAIVTLTIASFTPTGSGNCVIGLPLITHAGGNRVELRKATPTDHTIVVKQKGAAELAIQFVIVPAALYRAETITFVGESGTIDPDGRENFPPGRILKDQNAITVVNVFKHTGGSNNTPRPRWAYSIVVTEIASNRTGLIDPGIENSDQN